MEDHHRKQRTQTWGDETGGDTEETRDGEVRGSSDRMTVTLGRDKNSKVTLMHARMRACTHTCTHTHKTRGERLTESQRRTQNPTRDAHTQSWLPLF